MSRHVKAFPETPPPSPHLATSARNEIGARISVIQDN